MLLRYQRRTRRVHLEIGEYCRPVHRAPKSDIETDVWQNDEGQDDRRNQNHDSLSFCPTSFCQYLDSENRQNGNAEGAEIAE